MTITNDTSGSLLKQRVTSARGFVGRSLDKYRWIRFGIVGGIGSLLHFAVLYGLTEIAGLWYILSAVIAIIVAATSNFILNQLWTFEEKKVQNRTVGWMKFVLLAFITDGAYLLLLALFTEIVGFWYILSAFISLIIVFPFKYNISRLWIWGNLRLSMIISSKHPDEADYDWHAFTKGSPIQKWWKLSIAKAVWSFIPEHSTVLDIGCGSSLISARYKGVSIDCNRGKVEFMQAHSNGEIKREFLVADARKLPFKANTFNAVLCAEVIEHLENPSEVIAEIARAAKPNAKVVLATPDYSKPLAYVIDIMTPYGGYHTYRFTRKRLEKLCRDRGLKPIKHKYVGGCDLVELFEKTDTTEDGK